MPHRFRIDDALAKEVCAAVGAELPGTPAAIDDLYRSWCATIPFDCVSKALALADDVDPPGAEPTDLIDRWIATGLGGTCWAHCSAFSAVLAAAGIESSIGLDHTIDVDKVDFHCFVVVNGDDGPLAYDPIHLTDGGLPLAAGAAGDLGFYQAGFDSDGDRLVHRYRHPGIQGRYAVLSTTLDAADVRSFCRVSRTHSGVAARRFFTRHGDATFLTGTRPRPDGAAAEVSTWRGTADPAVSEVADRDELLARLGYHGDAAALLERSGLVAFPDGALRFAL